jgi:hypothetical protein
MGSDSLATAIGSLVMGMSPIEAAAVATREALRRAFPDSISPTVGQAIELIPAPPRAELGPKGRLGDLLVVGERVSIPYRIYSRKPAAKVTASLDQEAAVVLACAYTRHHDGYMRERSAKAIIHVDRAWIAPFVVQLLGEYVVEIAELVLGNVAEMRPETYQRLAMDNESFMRLTRNRIVSYWWCYYTGRYRLFDYPPVRVLMELGLWNGREGRHRLARARRSVYLPRTWRHPGVQVGMSLPSRNDILLVPLGWPRALVPEPEGDSCGRQHHR